MPLHLPKLVALSFCLPAVLGLFTVSLGRATQAQPTSQSVNLPVGLELRRDKTPFTWRGDFDNDGVEDALYAVKVTPQFKPKPTIKTLNFWSAAHASQATEPLALLLQSSRNRQTFLLRNAAYFDSPIWRSARLPVAVVKKGSPDYGNWRKQVSTLRGEGVILGTEAGIDTLLYWNGSGFSLYLPQETP